MPGSAAAVLKRTFVGAPRAFSWLMRETFLGAYRNGVLGNAKGAAYSALLAFFPLLATVAAVLVRAQAAFISDAITDFLARVLPPGTEDLVFYYFSVSGRQPVLVPVGATIVSIWGASGAIVSLMQGFKATYRIPHGRSFVRERIVAILLVFSAAIPALVASGLILIGTRAERWAAHKVGLLPATADWQGWLAFSSAIVRYGIALGAIALGTMILYRWGPNRPQPWRLLWPGAVLATFFWLGATLAFTWYVRNLANYNVMYGSIATAILLLVWMYLLAVIALIGCEFNAAYERRLGRIAV